jgi:hypothetical protein
MRAVSVVVASRTQQQVAIHNKEDSDSDSEEEDVFYDTYEIWQETTTTTKTKEITTNTSTTTQVYANDILSSQLMWYWYTALMQTRNCCYKQRQTSRQTTSRTTRSAT